VARGRVRADAGAHQRLVSSFRRSDGLTQVLYAGHALYTYQDDTSPGMVAGEGFTIYGGTWWLVAPSGKPVTG
jgi:predicted lipoprotein with Yx(FWY)xxD motif